MYLSGCRVQISAFGSAGEVIQHREITIPASDSRPTVLSIPTKLLAIDSDSCAADYSRPTNFMPGKGFSSGIFTIPAKVSRPTDLPVSISDSRTASLLYRQIIQHRQIVHARQLTIPTLFSSDTFTRGMFIIPASYSIPTNCSAASNHPRPADHSAPSNLYARQRIQPRHFPPLTCLPYRQPIQHRQTSA